jgi:hypothetical protein
VHEPFGRTEQLDFHREIETAVMQRNGRIRWDHAAERFPRRTDKDCQRYYENFHEANLSRIGEGTLMVGQQRDGIFELIAVFNCLKDDFADKRNAAMPRLLSDRENTQSESNFRRPSFDHAVYKTYRKVPWFEGDTTVTSGNISDIAVHQYPDGSAKLAVASVASKSYAYNRQGNFVLYEVNADFNPSKLLHGHAVPVSHTEQIDDDTRLEVIVRKTTHPAAVDLVDHDAMTTQMFYCNVLDVRFNSTGEFILSGGSDGSCTFIQVVD